MDKKVKHDSYAGLPGDAIRVKNIGRWDVYFSKSESSVYFRSASAPSELLRLTRDDLLKLAQGITVWRSVEKSGAVSREKNFRAVKDFGEKRRLRRFSGRCKCAFASGGVSSRGVASDFSIDGLFIRTTHPLESGSAIVIAAHLPDGSVASLQGKVRRTIGVPPEKMPGRRPIPGMGIELLRKDPNYLHFIRSLIR